MALLPIAQQIVVRTNDWPGLRSLYRWAYDGGLSIATNRLATVPGVLAVLLRVSPDGPGWVPGLSDYDVTVLTEAREPARMWPLLDRLWARYRQLKTALPQMGEMEVVNLGEFDDMLSFGPLPLSSLKRAHPLRVSPHCSPLETRVQAVRPATDGEILLDAITRYLRFLVPAWLLDARRPSKVSRRRVGHLLSNVQKRLVRLHPPVEFDRRAQLDGDLVQIVAELTRACRQMPRSADARSVDLSPPSRDVPKDTLAIDAFVLDVLRDSPVPQCSAVLWMSYLSTDRLNLAFVVPDEVPPATLHKLMTTLAAKHGETQSFWERPLADRELQRYFPCLTYPVVLSRSMWACWRALSPFEGVAAAATGRVLAGSVDALAATPSVVEMGRGAEVQYAAMLSLKNNWRPLRGPGTPRLYAAMVSHVRGYASAISGPVLTSLSDCAFVSAQEGYEAVSHELSVMRRRLTA